MNVQYARPNQNFELAAGMVEEAARRGSALVLLPELWSTGYDLTNGALHARANLAILERVQALATQMNIRIGGSLLLAGPDGRLYNTYTIYAPGQTAPEVTYNKIHLFRLLDEEKWLAPGAAPALVELPFARGGLATCYDLRFPELYRGYALNGANLFLMVSAWALARIEHWQVLLRARAIENQVFMAAVNAVGQTGPDTFGGASAIISPWGEVLCEGNTSGEALLTAEIDLGRVAEARARIPVFSDRRPDLY